MKSSELLIPGAVAGMVLVLGALLSMRRTHRPSLNRAVMRRMSRPDETADNDITKTDRHRRSGQELLTWFYQLNLLQKLEENLWQAGIYASMTIFLLSGAISLAIYVAIYGSHRPFDERITEIGVKMRVAYGNPLNLDMDSDTFARSLFRWVAKRLPEPGINTPK